MKMASAESINGGGGGIEEQQSNSVELVVSPADSDDSASGDHITPLLTQSEKPKFNIFSVSYPRKKPHREQVLGSVETEISPFMQFILWAWNGSRYSGLICMALSSSIYCTMEVLSDSFSAQAVPLFKVVSARCAIILILSFMWLRRSGEPISLPANVRILLVLRALSGCLSLLSFVYCIQSLPSSQAIMISFTTPIMASIVARIILHEKLKIAEIGGLAFSFFGVLFIFWPKLTMQGNLAKTGQTSDSFVQGSHHIYAVLIGLFSAITGGINFCLIRAGAKASDQPVVTVLSFAILAIPAAVICTFAFEEFVLPGLFSFLSMVVLGVLAFFAEVLLARGLQLEKTSKVANILFVEAVLSQLWGMVSLRIAPSFGSLAGCLLILASACCTMYIGPEKEIEDEV